MSGDPPAERNVETSRDTAAAHLRHELRTPLNHIIGYSEMLEDEARERNLDDFVPDLQRIGQAARTLQGLIERHVVALPQQAPAVSVTEDTSEAAEGIRQQLAAVRRALPETLAPADRIEARLLVVDDSEENRDMLSRRLRDQGYTVICAEGGRQALEVLESESIDLVLLDVMMPDVSGIEVLQTLRRQRSLSDVPVIMVTAMDRGEDTVVALKLGANDYVTKPLDFQVVLARTETQLALKRAKQRIDRLAADLEARNAFIRATFDRYMSADIVDNLLQSEEGPRLQGEQRKVSILMADLRGFTALVQQLDAERVVFLLNRYLGAMTEVIGDYGGTIDEFIGDAVLALFGAPVSRGDDAMRAVACAVRMQLAMREVNRLNEREGLPRLEMGVGIDTGAVIVGSIGSMVRAKYTAVGNSVNLASRIESCTVGGQVLISAATRAELGDAVRVAPPMRIQAKGFREPIEIFEVRGVGAPYDTELDDPSESAVMVALEPAVRVKCAVLDGKHLGEGRFDAWLVQLGDGAAMMRAEHALNPLDNVQLHLVGEDGNEIDGDIYGKVVATVEGGVLVRFTGMYAEAERCLRALR